MQRALSCLATLLPALAPVLAPMWCAPAIAQQTDPHHSLRYGFGNGCDRDSASLPYAVDFAVNGSPATGGPIDLTVTVTPTADVDRVSLKFVTDGVVALPVSLDRDLLGLTAGTPVSFPATVQLTGLGGGGLYCGTIWFEATDCGPLRRNGDEFAIFFHDDGSAVRSGPGSLANVEIDRILELQAAGTLTADQARVALDAVLAIRGDPTDPPPSLLEAAAGVDVSLSGSLRWTDSAGTRHPARQVDVRVYTGPAAALVEVAAGTAGSDGRYDFTLTPAQLGAGPRDVTIRVFARNFAADVVSSTAGVGTYFSEVRLANVADGSSIFVGRTANNTDVQDMAFSVADCMIVGSDYMQVVEGSRLASIDCSYPRADGGTASTYSSVTGIITVHRSKPLMWDVLLHEYGHYIANQFDMYQTGIGGPHAPNEDLIASRGKNDGTRLAWSEGLATYLGTAAQILTNAAALNVANAGDTTYHSNNATSGNAWDYSVEARDNFNGIGEGNELNVTRALWDVADAAVDGDDRVALGHQAVWDRLNGITPRRMFDAWSEFAGAAPVATRLDLGAVFSQNQISAVLTAPVDGEPIAAAPPTFKWDKNVLDEFTVRFYDDSFNPVGDSGPLGDVAEWTPTQAEWDAIRGAADTLLWAVDGENTAAPATGPYSSGSRKMGGVDFAFVIDDTGSMSEEIGGVRQALLDFLAGFDPASTALRFQLTTFKDSVTVRSATRDLAAITAQVSALRASGGGDCPENSVGGLSQGTRTIKRGGTVMLATDADPRPGSDLTALVDQLRRSGARVNILLSGTCSGTFRAGSQSGFTPLSLEPTTEGGGFSGAVDAYYQIAAATGGTFAFIPEVNTSAAGRAEYQNAANNILAASVGAHVVALAPSQVPVGASATVTLRGQNTRFSSTSTVAFDLPGVSVGAVRALSPLVLEVDVVVDPATTPGFSSVSVTTPLSGSAVEIAAGLGALRVYAPSAAPRIVAVTPPVVERGEAATLMVEGLNTAFAAGVSVLDLGADVAVAAVNVLSPTRLRAEVTVGEFAAIGFRSVSVLTAGEFATNLELPDCFLVGGPTPTVAEVVAVDPPLGVPGRTIDVVVDVVGILLQTGDTTVEFSGAGISVRAVVACGDRATATIAIAGDALAGPRDVIVRSSGQTAVALDGFVIQPILVQNVVVADGSITLAKGVVVTGDLVANGDIVVGGVGAPSGGGGTVTEPWTQLLGSATALGDVVVRQRGRIEGDATAGGIVNRAQGGVVTGVVTEGAALTPAPMPTLTFAAGGPDTTVAPGDVVGLLPGSHGVVWVGHDAVLMLGHDGTSGEYLLSALALAHGARLVVDVGQGPVTVRVVGALSFDHHAAVTVVGGDASQLVFESRSTRVTVGHDAALVGTLIAPGAAVRLGLRASWRGSITARALAADLDAVLAPN